MGDASDFTFCQVAPSSDLDVLESPKVIVDDGLVTVEASRLDAVDLGRVGDLSSSGSREKKSDGQSGAGPVTGSEVPLLAPRKPIVRSKVPFEKGFSQMDWLKVTRTHPDLAGLKGKSNRRLISMDEVRQHKTEGSIWTVLKGRVYNISPYMKFHPGGVDMLMKAAGKDCTSLFNKYHAWVNAEFLLEKCLIGVLEDSS